MSIAKDVRQFLRDLFESKYVQRVEQEADKVRADYEARLQDFRSQIADLKFDKATLQARVSQLENSTTQPTAVQRSVRSSLTPDFGGEPFEEKIVTPWQKAEAEWQKMQDSEDIKEAPVAQGA